MIGKLGLCAYCRLERWLAHTGRRWLCGECWREHLVESPLPSEPREHFGGNE